MSPENFQKQKEEIALRREQIQYLQEELKEKEISVKKEREVNRLTNVHVGNLENVIRAHEREYCSAAGGAEFILNGTKACLRRSEDGFPPPLTAVFQRTARED